MIRQIASFVLLSAMLASSPAHAKAPATTRVSIQTSEGNILIDLDMKRAPITAGNFLRYVEEKRFDGTSFYRAARTRNAEKSGFVQGGIRHSLRRSLPPIAHEPTSKTGLKHVDGAISMARNEPGSAMGDFFITVGTAASMDAHPGKSGDNLGYAVFGKVVGGMNVVRRILAAPTVPGAGSGGMKGQMITAPIRIIAARRAPN
jgi:peptidyl-prolyl cis-trans isomerase A (cyclophilin A)